MSIKDIALNDAKTLVDKGKYYGDSWKRRGGVGAFMMCARKWDRIENQTIDGEVTWDIFSAGVVHGDSMLDDIRDLRCYLLLIEAEIIRLIKERDDGEEATSSYVCQD